MKPAKPLPMSVGVRRPGCLLLPHYMVRPGQGWIIRPGYEYYGSKPTPSGQAGFYYRPGRAYFLAPECGSLFFSVNSSVTGISYSQNSSDNLFRDAESGHPVLWQYIPSMEWMFGVA